MEKPETPETIEQLAELVVDFLGALEKLHDNDPTRVSRALERTVTYYILERVKNDKRTPYLDIFCSNLRANALNLEKMDDDTTNHG